MEDICVPEILIWVKHKISDCTVHLIQKELVGKENG